MKKNSRKSATNNLAPGLAAAGTEITKVDGEAAGVAPGGETGTSGDGAVTEGEAAQDEPTAEAAPDPFADVPVTRIGDDVSFDDFSEVAGSDPRKYGAVHAAAVAERMPTVKGWKHERAMLTPGTNRRELKPGSVYGTIQAIVNAAGRAGIPAYVVATMLRRKQIGNKRSHYCDSLPPVGWAEGWINTAISKSIAGVHPTKQAPAIRATVTEGEAAANAADAQGKIAANS